MQDVLRLVPVPRQHRRVRDEPAVPLRHEPVEHRCPAPAHVVLTIVAALASVPDHLVATTTTQVRARLCGTSGVTCVGPAGAVGGGT